MAVVQDSKTADRDQPARVARQIVSISGSFLTAHTRVQVSPQSQYIVPTRTHCVHVAQSGAGKSTVTGVLAEAVGSADSVIRLHIAEEGCPEQADNRPETRANWVGARWWGQYSPGRFSCPTQLNWGSRSEV